MSRHLFKKSWDTKLFVETQCVYKVTYVIYAYSTSDGQRTIWYRNIFNSIIHTYFRLFMLSHKKSNCYPLTRRTWKMSPHYLVKCKTFYIWLQVMLHSSKCWWLWKEPVVGWHWWLWKGLTKEIKKNWP